MSELKELKFPAFYSQLAKDFIDTITQSLAFDFSIAKGLELINIPVDILQNPEALLDGVQVCLMISLGKMLAKKDEPLLMLRMLNKHLIFFKNILSFLYQALILVLITATDILM